MNNSGNKKEGMSLTDCPVTFCMSRIGGKWKPVILHLISKGANRFGLLQKGIEGVSKQMLTKQLREMESDGILIRTIFPEIPPRVEYEISEFGMSLMPIIQSMRDWGERHMKEESRQI